MVCLLFLISPIFALDGQSNPASEAEINALWLNPGCSGRWLDVKANVGEIAGYAEKFISEITDWDSDIRECFFGIITLLYHQTGLSQYWFSVLDQIYSSVHPTLLDNAGWGITDQDIGNLRRTILLSQKTVSSRLNVYVYDIRVRGSSFCAKGQWGIDVLLHDYFLSISVSEAELADVFFVPIYGICMFEAGFYTLTELDLILSRTISTLEYWGSNKKHVFVFGSGLGLNVWRSWRQWLSGDNVIVITPETGMFNGVSSQVRPDFVIGRDIVVPGNLQLSEIVVLINNGERTTRSEERRILGCFFGRIDSQRQSHAATEWMGDIDRVRERLGLYEGMVDDVMIGRGGLSVETVYDLKQCSLDT